MKEEVAVKATRARRTKKQVDDTAEESGIELGDWEADSFFVNVDDEQIEELVQGKNGEDDSGDTYGWPPLVCCFGATQHLFVPSGRQANRLVDYEMQERLKEALWIPENFVRAPGGCASDVAVALARCGGKVAFMGKIGDDDFGQSFVNYLNVNHVQTRSICIDNKRVTAVSRMKIGKRGGLRTTCIRPCAEDSLSRSEINIDVLREVRYFHFYGRDCCFFGFIIITFFYKIGSLGSLQYWFLFFFSFVDNKNYSTYIQATSLLLARLELLTLSITNNVGFEL